MYPSSLSCFFPWLPHNVWLKSLKIGHLAFETAAGPLILNTCSTEKKKGGREKQFGTFFGILQKAQSLNYVILNISFEFFTLDSKQWKSQKSSCSVGSACSYPRAELEFESKFPNSRWNILYSVSHLSSPKGQICNDKFQCLHGFYSFVNDFYTYYLLYSLSASRKWVR